VRKGIPIAEFTVHSNPDSLQIWFLAACGIFMAIGVTEYNQGLKSVVKLAEVNPRLLILYILLTELNLT
jgi:hypothetical protein